VPVQAMADEMPEPSEHLKGNSKGKRSLLEALLRQVLPATSSVRSSGAGSGPHTPRQRQRRTPWHSRPSFYILCICLALLYLSRSSTRESIGEHFLEPLDSVTGSLLDGESEAGTAYIPLKAGTAPTTATTTSSSGSTHRPTSSRSRNGKGKKNVGGKGSGAGQAVSAEALEGSNEPIDRPGSTPLAPASIYERFATAAEPGVETGAGSMGIEVPTQQGLEDTDNIHLLADEMRDLPPKRPLYWWFRYRNAQGGFKENQNDALIGPTDHRAARRDETCGEAACGGGGACFNGTCTCAAIRSGKRCQNLRVLPGFEMGYKGAYTLNQELLAKNHGVRFPTDPTDDPSPTAPFVHLPVTKELWTAQPKKDIFGGVIYKTCAVVGNSGLAQYYEHGEEIDQHDMIVRFNRAPTHKHVRHVGRRTSFRISTPVNAGWREENETTLMPMPTKSYMYLQVVYHKKHPKARVHLLDTEFNSFAANGLKALPTVGFLGILLALHRCAKISVYNFYIHSQFGINYHYFNSETENKKKTVKYSYDFAAEWDKIQGFAREGLIEIPQPCAMGCERDTGIKCTTCPPGSTCTCLENYPMPVALAGFCRMKGNYTCFYRCPGGVAQCPGGIQQTKCPREMTLREGDADGARGLTCATFDEVEEMAMMRVVEDTPNSETGLPESVAASAEDAASKAQPPR